MGRLKALPPLVRTLAPLVRVPEKYVDPFYESPEWRAFAREIKQQRGYICEDCGKDCTDTPRGLIADHIVERKDGGADFDPLNTCLRCTACHNRKTAKARTQRNMTV